MSKECEKVWNKEWTKYIDINEVDIYPIQFANCDRLEKNNAVFIFDEVGSGKTISSGLMALHYLYNHPDKKVLVITTNALTKMAASSNSEYGQFLKDWMDKLPFGELKLENKIEVVNNHYSNLASRENKDRYGLVIVDEAQLFLNKESQRHEYLCKIKADKIVFLTATPIKSLKCDLYVYVDIARSVTTKKVPDNWIDEISTVGKEPEKIICSKFDADYPVTRYFKDTIMSLKVENYEKRQARRLNPQLWEYDCKEKKDEVLLKRINEKCREGNNRFIIFTRFVDKEARAIGELLKNNGFEEFTIDDSTNAEKTYKVVTGENGGELSGFGRIDNLPTVLILTYQIAEQGVNLPGYNYVINYHISAFPSALEQRFGRIDRMGKNGSKYTEINMCFLISREKENLDTNTWNFYCAINTYLRNLISYLPSRNTILTTEIIQKYSETREYIEIYKDKIRKLLNQPEQMEYIIRYFEMLSDDNISDKLSVECSCDEELFQFIDENAIEFDITCDREKAKKEFKKEVNDVFSEYSKNLGGKQFNKDECIELIESVSDKIFYSDNEEHVNVRTVDAIVECGEEYIKENSNYKEYSNKFKKNVELPLLIEKYLDLKKINNFYEQKFNDNDFESLFPYEGYAKVIGDFLRDKGDMKEEEKKLIRENSDIVISQLPIFKLFHLYEKLLKKQVYTQKGEIRMRFDFCPLSTAFSQTQRTVLQDVRHCNLSDNFINKNFKYENFSDLYSFAYDENSRIVEATNWHKLTYHYTRKEEACFINRCLLYDGDKCSTFYKEIDELIRYLASDYALCDSEQRCWREKDDKYQSAERRLEELIKRRDQEIGKHRSLFNYFAFTDSGKRRQESRVMYDLENMMKDMHPYQPLQTKPSDWWTQGILNETRYCIRRDITLGEITELPNSISELKFF